MQPSAFFHFLPFLCGIHLGGPASAQARGSKAAISTGQLPSLLSWDLGIPEKSNQPGTFILAKFLAKESNSV
jgi:hypothetical protein